MFSLELLQAINNWQFKGIGSDKELLAQQIAEHAKSLPTEFKNISTKCYRKIDLTGNHTFNLGLHMKLEESYSSWTFDSEIAKDFSGGVPPKGWQGVIFELTPEDTSYEVIINLDALFSNSNFLNACHENKNKIKGYSNGIGCFMNIEREVIVKIPELHIHQLWAYGGYSNSREKLAETVFGHKPDANELVQFDEMMKKAGMQVGPAWVTGAGKDLAVKTHIATAQLLAKEKNTGTDIDLTQPNN